MRFAFIEAERALKPAIGTVSELCQALGVSRTGYYAWAKRPPSEREKRDQQLRLLVHAAHERGRRKYGSPRVHRALKKQGETVGRKRVIRLMQEEGLVGRPKKRFKHTTDSDHGRPVAENLLKRDFTAKAPNQRWVGDTTELRTPQGKLFLAVIIDLFSRFVVGWALSAVNDRHVTLKALNMAVTVQVG